ncbi:MAG: tetratricopeptide (TPR) repeat protein [Myxococcota bacterium]|jgi:tetratricopeptide (TPR) repeat protein
MLPVVNYADVQSLLMSKLSAIVVVIVSLSWLSVQGSGGGNPFVEKFINASQRHYEEKDYVAALSDIERALERDDQHLGALEQWALVAEAMDDKDTAAYAWHAWLKIVEAADKSPISRKRLKEVKSKLASIDPFADDFTDLSGDYIKELFKIEKAHSDKGRHHSAIKVVQEILHINPQSKGAQQRLKEIERGGGADTATVDLFAGTDPTAGVDSEWIDENNAKHSEWKDRWHDETEHYRVHTNAGYLVLKTAGIAMDQMNLAYRKFFHYQEDGGSVPKIDVNVFKSRDEYLKLGQGPPVEWSAGHFTGNAVETYIGGTDGVAGLKGMYETLFHEAAHQFVSLTGKGGVPGWLNEAYASFFEGTDILSNGTVRWNRVNGGRLFALVPRLEQGWMEDHNDGVRDEEGEWATPPKAPSLRMLIENQYGWGPPWYAPTWGVVYFLYNYREPTTGRAVLRDPLHNYYLSGAASKGLSQRIQHFEEFVLSRPDAPCKTVDELNVIMKAWLLRLRDQTIGKESPEDDLLAYADMALERGEDDLALELLEEALLYAPDDVEAQWEMAKLLHELELDDRAAAMYSKFANEMALRGLNDDSRVEKALALVTELDPLFKKHKRLQVNLEEQGLELAHQYYDLKMYRMAMEITRRMSASWSMPDAMAFYTKIAKETGITLSRWKVAYNEMSLDGWRPLADKKSYRAYGTMIEATVVNDPEIETLGEELQTRALIYDTSFNSDFSLETQFRFSPLDPGMLGLCFGFKDSRNTQVLMLHRKGSLEVKTQLGGAWIPRDKQQVVIGHGWHKIRIDVVTQVGAKAVVDIYFDDKYLRTIKMSRSAVRGSFGLFTTTGNGAYRNVRMLVRDAHDPASRIERQLTLEKRLSDPDSRAPGVFQGLKPPNLPQFSGEWLQGEPLDLEQRIGDLTLMAFWTPQQDELIPTADYYSMLAKKYKKYGVKVVCIATNQHTAPQILDWVATHPLEDISVYYDTHYKIYPAYNIGNGGLNIPRVLLIDVDGKVYWEGDPNLPFKRGWDKNAPIKTPVDTVIEELIAERQMREILKHAGKLSQGLQLFEVGEWRNALDAIAPLVELDADYSKVVLDAKLLRDKIEAEGAALPIRAEALIEEGRLLAAQALLQTLVIEFKGTTLADDLGAPRKRQLERSKTYRAARSNMLKLKKAEGYIDSGSADKAREILSKMQDAQTCIEVAEFARELEQRLKL